MFTLFLLQAMINLIQGLRKTSILDLYNIHTQACTLVFISAGYCSHVLSFNGQFMSLNYSAFYSCLIPIKIFCTSVSQMNLWLFEWEMRINRFQASNYSQLLCSRFSSLNPYVTTTKIQGQRPLFSMIITYFR